MNLPMIFSLLALILSVASCAFTKVTAFQNQRERKGMILYFDNTAEQAREEAKKHMDARIGEMLTLYDELKEKVSALESGVTPDFEKAKAAADAVNSFNMGISAILGYDPAEAIKNSRNETRGESE